MYFAPPVAALVLITSVAFNYKEPSHMVTVEDESYAGLSYSNLLFSGLPPTIWISILLQFLLASSELIHTFPVHLEPSNRTDFLRSGTWRQNLRAVRAWKTKVLGTPDSGNGSEDDETAHGSLTPSLPKFRAIGS
ncbi:hypothetical protein DFH07DRAFT_590047 [Mycena maculata]|uniref:Uncharacterized protein n=1 Tax=Mycena maculata TaxID=230809 RepID=A0AAD7N5H8_9AGAR|nr:hypothetical protein DFH07DRAFT_590047 [Mycena maculata]